MRNLSIFLFLGLLVQCSSTIERRRAEFEAVKIGMVKSEVLDVAGPPFWSDHNDGFDRWIYYMEPEGRQSEKIIYFQNGTVVRKGLREKPVLTAEEMEEIKKPKPEKMKPFTPTYNQKELRKVIKKAVDKEEKKKKPKKYPGATYEKL